MIFDSTLEVSEDEVLEADVCIVGAGAAGITLARALRGSGLSVLVLEAGGHAATEAIQDPYRGTMSGLRTWELHAMRRRQLGGSTNDWAGWCMPFLPEDFEERSYIPHSGWPITYADIEPYYHRASSVVEIGDFNWDLDFLAERSGQPVWPDEAGYETRVFKYSPPTRFRTRYGNDLEQAEDVSVYLFACVVDIRLEDTLDSVSRLECRAYAGTGSGTRFYVEAGRYVLAMGGLENARVLLASRSQVPDGVANGHGLVGRYFMEHPHYYTSVGLLTPDPVDVRFYRPHTVTLPSGGGTRDMRIMGAWAPDQALRDAEGLVDFTMQILPDRSVDGIPITADTLDVLLARAGDEPTEYRFSVRAEQSPDPDSRITLASQTDALGMPRIDLRWTIRGEDDEGVYRALRSAGAFMARAAGGRLFIPSANGAFTWRAHPGGHHLGTTRMADEPGEGVVDRDGRCFDVENLYVAGSSVFTTGASCNPTLTVVALAERLADHLAESP